MFGTAAEESAHGLVVFWGQEFVKCNGVSFFQSAATYACALDKKTGTSLNLLTLVQAFRDMKVGRVVHAGQCGTYGAVV